MSKHEGENILSYLDTIESTPLTGDDLISISGTIYYKNDQPKVKYLLYDDLININHIEELFYPDYNCVYLLYQIKQPGGNNSSVGHWITVIKFNSGSYSHFDSYGLNVEEELHITHEPTYLKKLYQGKNVEINDTQYQEYSHMVNTCGLWCVMRSLLYKMNNEQFKMWLVPLIRSGIKPDDIITLITRFHLNK